LGSVLTTEHPRRGWILLVASALFVAVVAFLVMNRNIPLGVLGEWVWNRHPAPAAFGFLPVVVGAAIFIWLSKFMRRMIDRNAHWAPIALGAAMAVALPLQLSIFNLPHTAMERWFLSLHNPSSSGYFAVARDLQRRGVSTEAFLRDYEKWIAAQDSFHIGTHPPGLFAAYQKLLAFMEGYAETAERVLRLAPARLGMAAVQIGRMERLNTAESATLVAAGLLTWCAFWLTTPFVYLLARRSASPGASFAATSLWLLTPGPLLFLPVADAAYPLFAAAIGYLLITGPHKGTATAAATGLAAGVVFFIAINLSLAFLVVLSIAGLAGLIGDFSALRRSAWWTTWLAFAVAVAALLIVCRSTFDLDLLAVCRINLEKHRGFYEHFPRSYWPWVAVNLFEFAATIGVFAVLAVAACIWRPKRTGTALAISFLATLLLLDLAGKNLSEAGRLWLFLTPFAAAASARVLERTALSPRQSAALLVLQAAAAVSLYTMVEPLLPQPVVL
jgi:methylthioxylose transferase